MKSELSVRAKRAVKNLRQVGIEPTTNRLKAECSTGELLAHTRESEIKDLRIKLVKMMPSQSFIRLAQQILTIKSLDFKFYLLFVHLSKD